MPHVERGAPGAHGAQGGPAGGPPPLPPELSPRRGTDGGGGRYAGNSQGGQGGPGGPGGGPGGGGRAPSARGPVNWKRRIKWTVITLVTLFVVVSVGTYFWADSKLNREDVLSDYKGRPEAGEGTNYLIVGSDSREGLSDGDKQKLRTGSAGGKRTDTMMVLHTGDNGSTLLSIPRDSFVTIPAFTGESGKKYPASQHKINTAYGWGGGQLLSRTVEFNTGLRIDHYAEIGFGGFANIVDALGGVEMCFDKPLKDRDSGADFQKGCHDLNGAQSLAFVRQRHQEADQDLGRMRNQQKFLSTLANQAASPSTILNPFTLFPTVGAGAESLTVDEDDGLFDLASMFWAMKGVTSGDGKSMTVPIATSNLPTPRDGVAVKWDMNRGKPLFEQLKKDEKVTVKGGA
jgi:LCP family protein required for cell wall assembly